MKTATLYSKYIKQSLKALLLVAAVLLPLNANALDCPVTVEYQGSTTLITAPGGAKFKIEAAFIKTLLPTAFDQEEWGYVPLGNGASKITGELVDGNEDKVVSTLIALKRNYKVDWYLTVNKDLASANGKWIVVASINNKITCSEASAIDEVSIDESLLSTYELKQTRVRVVGAAHVYSRFGLN